MYRCAYDLLAHRASPRPARALDAPQRLQPLQCALLAYDTLLPRAWRPYRHYGAPAVPRGQPGGGGETPPPREREARSGIVRSHLGR